MERYKITYLEKLTKLLHNKECLRKHSPVIFIAPVVLMEVLNVVVDQNRALNPEKKEWLQDNLP